MNRKMNSGGIGNPFKNIPIFAGISWHVPTSGFCASINLECVFSCPVPTRSSPEIEHEYVTADGYDFGMENGSSLQTIPRKRTDTLQSGDETRQDAELAQKEKDL